LGKKCFDPGLKFNPVQPRAEISVRFLATMQVEMKRLHGKTFNPGYNFDPGLKRLPCNHALDLNIDAWNTRQAFTLLI
jgi:hypothetical protein